MKIGIITIQKSEVNYGACLQSYALWRYVSLQGYDSEVIDLLRPCHAAYRISPSLGEKKDSLRIRLSKWIHGLLSSVSPSAEERLRLQKFSDFNAKVSYSKCYESVESLYSANPDYDVVITGSDQVWNPYMPFLNAPYFQDFVRDDCKRISYASSFGIDSLPEDVLDSYRTWLSRYAHISIRENSGADIIERLIGKRPQVVLDPVFLLSREDWMEEMSCYAHLPSKQYVLLYMLHFDSAVLECAKTMAGEKKMPLYVVLSENRKIQDPEVKQLEDVGPAEWLWLICNADTMVTNSFHGSMFCVIFGTPFMVVLNRQTKTNTRIIDTLTRLSLLDCIRYQDDAEDNVYSDEVSSMSSADILAKEIDEAKSYLMSSIEE